MHLEVLVEEASTEKALSFIIPKVVGQQHTFQIHNFQNKRRLLKELPKRMQAYERYIPDDWRVVVVVDEDRQDCIELKRTLEDASQPLTGRRGEVVLNRIAVEEIEAWYWGDLDAMRVEYPRLPNKLNRKQKFRDPDAIGGGTWEQLDKVLRDSGYGEGLLKVRFAEQVTQHMNIERNSSKSFQVFCNGLRRLVDS